VLEKKTKEIQKEIDEQKRQLKGQFPDSQQEKKIKKK
jgi:hypothetical protein